MTTDLKNNNHYNFRLTIQYDGTKYNGWQRLPGNDKTIQGKIEAVASRMLDTNIEIIGSGRTDKGVHSRMQVANFFYTPGEAIPMATDKMLDYFNNYLPDDIAVTRIEQADPRFHARFNCTSKIYRYSIDNNKVRNIFQNRFRYHIPSKLDINAMKKAASFFIGKKDFQSFTSMKSKTKSTTREIFSIDFVKSDDGLLDIYYKGDGFLYNMVRIITGTLVEVGHGRLSPDSIPQILSMKDRSQAGYTVPPHGLCLHEVIY